MSASAILNTGVGDLEKVKSYKCLGVYIGFGSVFKDAEINGYDNDQPF